jgi:tetratricopeptide (TPR) repeat protein
VDRTFEIIRGTVLLVLFLAIAIYVGRRWIRSSSDDPSRLITKWILSVVLFGGVLGGMTAPPFGLFIVLPCTLIMAILWAPNIGAFVSKPLTDMFDGGDEQAEDKPAYSIASARRMQGRYTDALAEVQKQLEKFPEDFEGQMLRATILAENLNDLAGAELAIQKIVSQTCHLPAQIAAVYTTLADWHLKFGLDIEAAKTDLKHITERFPDSEIAQVAAQRILHLGEPDKVYRVQDRQPLVMKVGERDLGLKGKMPAAAPEEDVAEVLAGYLKRLSLNPHDWETREALAFLYAEKLGQLDEGIAQMNYLIALPHQPQMQIMRWFQIIVDLQMRLCPDKEPARQTLRRIIEMFPEGAAADRARDNLTRLADPSVPKPISQPVALPAYERYLGLKGISVKGSEDGKGESKVQSPKGPKLEG